jgi:hypothetical protein
MQYANIFQRGLAFVVDLLVLCVVLIVVGAEVLTPLAMAAAIALGSKWGWEGWGWGMAVVLLTGTVLVTYIYFVRGWTGRGTPGERLLRLAVLRSDQSRPNLKQATLRIWPAF